METSFWVLGHRVDVLSYLFRFFAVFAPEAVRAEILAPDPRYPQRVYGYQEMFRLLEAQGTLAIRNPTQSLSQFHAGGAAALALGEGWWLLLCITRTRLTGCGSPKRTLQRRFTAA